MVEKIRALGGTVTGEPAPVIGGSGTAIIAFVQDPDGYNFKILERASTPEPLCQVMLHALGMKLQRKFDRPEHKHSLAMIGYGDEFETDVLELTYNYGVTEYSKGNGYAQAILVAISTNDVYKSGEVVKLSNSFHLKMAEAAPVAPNAELLEWPKKDKRRLLHAVYRVGDLDRTIKFYTEGFGMKLLRKRDIPEEKYSNAFLAFGPEESNFAVELTYNYGVTSYDIGAGFGHFGIATQDVYKMVENIRALGGNVTREPGPVKGGNSVIAFVKDPDGYIFELIQRGPTPEPLCQVMLRVGDLDRSIKFYEKALGMKLLRKIERPEYKYTLAMIGYADEYETTVLELTYNYGVTEYAKGNAYAQVAISTDDVYKSAEVVDLVTQDLGGKITRQPGPLPGINTKITAFLDPDGWKTVLVDNEDFLKELHKEE
ncbi:hypothetical protein JRO89_XS06G0168000 [Xanthoceras sorbifolium]|uniref:lactoylglutathione lyase n=1 Tax=Xanthoceras sorbifolium TaxID=99658 RepID=A0ABQ8HYQ1_9ROSI|nr:hypothetical protein JRO89_XS06G0168000 [Xanthoceras sorbifolium]